MSKINMPAENVFGVDSVEYIIEKCEQKLRKVLENCYVDQDGVKELKEVIDYQKIIKKRIKLLLENPEFEGLDQDDLTSTPWERLGHGCFGTVYKAKMKGASVAVKILKGQTQSTQLRNEGRILRLLRHDNIVAYRGMDFLKKDLIQYNLKQGSLMMIMEYVPDNLAKYVESLKTHEVHGLPKNQIWDFGQQIISGLYYLHSSFIAHRDLKPDNVLVEKGVAQMRLKLADFGGAFRSQSIEEGFINEQNQRWSAPEFWSSADYSDDVYNVDFYMKCDIFSYGLVLIFMVTGEQPWSEQASHAVFYARQETPDVVFPEKLKAREPLREICEGCCNTDPSVRPTAQNIVTNHFQAHKENPYAVASTTAEFFTCGFLKDTKIVVADSLVDESLAFSYGADKRPPGYPADCLLCEVDIDNSEHNECPDNFVYEEKYYTLNDHWRRKVMDKVIDDNANIALKSLTTPREGDEEQRVELKLAEATYVHHRAMRDVWKDLEEDEKSQILPCKTSVHPVFSTSFGLHVAVLTADNPRKFVFTRRAKRGGMASPGTFTCGAVESCSTKDYIKRGDKTYVQLIKTAARGLEEELGVVLTGRDVDAITLTTVYLKYDNHEWGMCGFVDLSDERIAPEHRLKFPSLNSRFTGGPKDKFEHDRLVAIPFELHEMAHFVRSNFHDFASSAKLVVVKVLQSFFGVSQVEDTFKALDASD